MAEEDDSQKTEDPTDRKLQKAKEKGQVGTSQEVKSWAILMGGGLVIALLMPWMMTRTSHYIAAYIEQAGTISLNLDVMPTLLTDMLIETGIIVAPLFGVLMVVAFAASVAQSGWLFAPTKIKPELSKISVLKGLKRMFSWRSIMEFFKGMFKLSILGLVSVAMAVPWLLDIAVLPDLPLSETMDRLFIVCLTIIAGSLIVMFVVAVIDFIYQKFEFTKSMRMSRQEVKDEHKDVDGDPQVKARIRKIRQERAQQRMMQNVPKADVVVTNPTHYAVALEYKPEAMHAPRLVAKGVDTLALRIREVADENDVPIVENPPLARALYAAVDLDEEIPVEHYQAVAEIIGYVMGLKTNRTSGNGPTVN